MSYRDCPPPVVRAAPASRVEEAVLTLLDLLLAPGHAVTDLERAQCRALALALESSAHRPPGLSIDAWATLLRLARYREYDVPPLPRDPIDHPPGPVERVLVRRERLRRGEQLKHPHDCTPAEELDEVEIRATLDAHGISRAKEVQGHE